MYWLIDWLNCKTTLQIVLKYWIRKTFKLNPDCVSRASICLKHYEGLLVRQPNGWRGRPPTFWEDSPHWCFEFLSRNSAFWIWYNSEYHNYWVNSQSELSKLLLFNRIIAKVRTPWPSQDSCLGSYRRLYTFRTDSVDVYLREKFLRLRVDALSKMSWAQWCFAGWTMTWQSRQVARVTSSRIEVSRQPATVPNNLSERLSAPS